MRVQVFRGAVLAAALAVMLLLCLVPAQAADVVTGEKAIPPSSVSDWISVADDAGNGGAISLVAGDRDTVAFGMIARTFWVTITDAGACTLWAYHDPAFFNHGVVGVEGVLAAAADTFLAGPLAGEPAKRFGDVASPDSLAMYGIVLTGPCEYSSGLWLTGAIIAGKVSGALQWGTEGGKR